MAALVEYLTQLNSSDSQQGIWVNPEDINDFIVRPLQFGYNAQTYGDRVCIGTLDKLSFGYQSERDAFCCWVSGGISTEKMPKTIQTIEYQGRKVQVAPEALYEAWIDGSLDESFASFIQEATEEIFSQWASDEAESFVANELPAILESAKNA
jgi:hypothetical protein